MPATIAPKKSLAVSYQVTFNCANDPSAGTPDYELLATISHVALDGQADGHPDDDVCPHDRPAGCIDPIDNVKDNGCGGKNTDGSLGAAMLVDVQVK